MMLSSVTLQVSLCTVLCFVTSAAEVTHVSGYEGRRVSIPCPYEGFDSYAKYLCKNGCEDADVLIENTEVKKGRYSAHDDKQKHIFTVTISDLRSTDVGKYWCGVTRTGFDSYIAEVTLEVKREWCCVKTKNVSGIVGSPITLSCPYPTKHRDNRKFLCQGEHRSNCTDVVTSGSRFTLQDDVLSSCFLVMVTKLEEGDAGMYWCGSDSQWSVENYTRIELTVVQPLLTTKRQTPKSEVGHVPQKGAALLKMVAYVVPAVLVMLSFALVVIYKCRSKGSEVSPDETMKQFEALDMVCETPDVTAQSKKTSRINKKAETQENVYRSLTKTEDIYSVCQ